MNIKTRMLLLGALILVCLPAWSADYAVQKTFWSFTSNTNNPATATNLAAAIDLTQFADFSLVVSGGITNAAAGTLDLQWDTSVDGTTFGTSPSAVGSSGWFAVPLTNAGTAFLWTTNITVNTVGYWRLRWLTNASGQHATNVVIRGYVKPKRTNKDF